MKANVTVDIDLKMEAWAIPADGDSLNDLIDKVIRAGNRVLQIDFEHQRVLIGKVD